ncbi:hypothetical protein [Raineya sp.]|mgnify:CR=1 FL=1|jgi:predicted nuclease with TOPRIM domain
MQRVLLIFLLVGLSARAQQSVPFTLDDRDRLIKIEQKLDEMEKRFTQRFEQMDKRFEELRTDMNARFEQQTNFLWILTAIFSAVTAAALGFAWWDRRTMIRPFETKVKEIEEKIELNQKDVKNIMLSLREVAKKNNEVAEILKQYNLL